MTAAPASISFTDRLDREWTYLRRRPTSVRRARGWAALDPEGMPIQPLAEVDDLQELLDLTRGGGASDLAADELLCRLVEIAQHDALAGRVVIQRILPGLISRSARYFTRRDPVDPAEVAVAAAWIAMRSYDWRRRRRHVAASLISDATFQAFRRPLRRRAATEEIRSPHTFWRIPADPGPGSAPEELAAVLEEADCAGVPAHDVELIRHLVRAGSPGLVARERGVTPRTIRNHRGTAIERLRAALFTAA